MDEIQQAHHELDRLQGIITRHEGHMYALRGWLLVIIGGLLAAYYTETIDMSASVLSIGLVFLVILFLILESRHVNLVDAVVERVGEVERQVRVSRQADEQFESDQYNGPRVNDACLDGASRWWPKAGMTFLLNQPFYYVVIAIVLLITLSLPPKQIIKPSDSSTIQPVEK